MGEKFVGSLDVVLHPSAARSANGQTGYFDVEAEISELDLVVSAQSGDDVTIIVETEVGFVVKSFTVGDTDDQSFLANLGGLPGGRRLRCRYIVPTSVTFALTVRESRSGLG